MKFNKMIAIISLIIGLIGTLYTVLTYYHDSSEEIEQKTSGDNSSIFNNISGNIKLEDNQK